MKLRFTILFVVLSLTGFSQWEKLSTPTNSPLFSLSFFDSNNGMVGGTGGTLLITEDAGQTWWTPMNCPQEDFYAVYMLNPQIMFIGGTNLYRTGDGGETWTMVSDMTSPRSISFSDPMTGKCTSVSGIYETTDGGFTWTEIPSAGTAIYETVQTFEDTDITMGNIGGMVTYSAVGKRTSEGEWYDFDVMSYPNSYAWTACSFPTPDTGYVFFNQYNHWVPSAHNQFLRFTNFVLSTNPFNDLVWFFSYEIINDTIPDYMTSVHFVNNNSGYATGEQGSLYYTANGGTSWKVDYSGTSVLTSMQFINDNLAFAVGYDGTVLKHDVSTRVENNELNSFTIYPNPASGHCIINDTRDAASIEILSTSGQLIRSIKGTSEDTIEISACDLKAGLYIIKITTTDNRVKAAKLMIK